MYKPLNLRGPVELKLEVGTSTDGWGSFRLGPHLFYVRKHPPPMTLQEAWHLGQELLDKLQELVGAPLTESTTHHMRMVAEKFLRDKLCVGEIYEYSYEEARWQNHAAEAIDTEGETAQ